jgi:uncharacterized protein (DUF58 family)
MRIRLTELGAKGLLLLAALELAFLATSYSNLFFLLLVFCGVLGALGLATGIRNLRAVQVQTPTVPAAPAATERPVRIAIVAPRQVFDLVLTLDDGRAGIPLPPVPAACGATVLAATLPPLPRGVRAIAALRMTSRFPFGLFEISVARPLAVEIVTYPAPAGAHAAHAGGGGDSGVAEPAAGCAGLRPFRAGDAVRDVHWRATARRGAPVVKEREGTDAAPVTIVVDRRGSDAALERTLASATAALFAAVAANQPVHFASQGLGRRLAGGQPLPIDLLRWLAGAAPLPADASAPDPGREPQHA